MSMTDPTPTPTKPKRPPRRVKKAARPAQPSEFAGLTDSACCDGCNAERCVISGINVCGHPNKGGLQARQMTDPKKLATLARATEYLGRA